MYKVSVICPVYNCEDKIERTITSIINQTLGFDNIELILVDDCSTDSSVEIIEQFCSKYDNIKLFTSEVNHGLPGYGRNVGIKNANAEYLMFIDNDDEYFPNFCELAYNSIMKFDADVVSFNHLFIHNDKIRKEDTFSRVTAKNDNNFKLINLTGIYYFQSPFIWTKVFKKSTIINNNVSFIEDKMNEDLIFLYNLYYYANLLVYANYYGYKWHRDGSSLSYYSIRITLNILNSAYDLCELVDNKYDNVNYSKMFADFIEATIIRICMSFNDFNEIKPLVKELYQFEKYIDFNERLNHIWGKVINYFILKKFFSISAVLIYILRKIKILYDLIM